MLFHFFQLPVDFFSRPKAAFCKAKVHKSAPKGVKMSVLFFLNQMAFLHVFLPAISFFSKSFSILLPLQKQHFASLKRIVLPQKEEKCHFSFSLMKRHFFMHFYLPFHFFKVFFNFASVAKAAFCKSRAHRGTPKGGKMSLLFFPNEKAFFHAFLRVISFFPTPFRICLPSTSSIL